MLAELTRQLAAAQPLADGQIRLAVERLADEKVPADVKADFLISFAKKGETPGEIAAFARALREITNVYQPSADGRKTIRELRAHR